MPLLCSGPSRCSTTTDPRWSDDAIIQRNICANRFGGRGKKYTLPQLAITMAFATDQYQLLDFGEGRKLERFGTHILDRPSVVAENKPKSHPDQWSAATARYDQTGPDQGEWRPLAAVDQSWSIRHESVIFQLKSSPLGQVGIFPEQAHNWDWIARQVARAGQPIKVLNLFAYTGGSTLAAAQAGAEVVHVDAARNMIARAKSNAESSGLADASIRWITEDAFRFAKREVKRGKRYDAVILDPPSYGHGPKGQVWRLTTGIKPLLRACGELTGGQFAFVLLTCHTPGYGESELRSLLAESLVTDSPKAIRCGPLMLTAPDGRMLRSGMFARWSSHNE